MNIRRTLRSMILVGVVALGLTVADTSGVAEAGPTLCPPHHRPGGPDTTSPGSTPLICGGPVLWP